MRTWERESFHQYALENSLLCSQKHFVHKIITPIISGARRVGAAAGAASAHGVIAGDKPLEIDGVGV